METMSGYHRLPTSRSWCTIWVPRVSFTPGSFTYNESEASRAQNEMDRDKGFDFGNHGVFQVAAISS